MLRIEEGNRITTTGIVSIPEVEGERGNMDERSCEICGKPLNIFQKKYCSKRCFGKGMSGKNHPRYKPEIHNRPCEVCGKPLSPQGSNGIPRKYCSKKCYGKANRGENSPHWKPELGRICETCGNDLNRWQRRFCSQKCFGKWQSQVRIGENSANWNGGPAQTECENCGTPLTLERGFFNSYEHHFCTDECYRSWRGKTFRGENHPNWRGGISFLPHSMAFTEKLKEQIRDRDDRECQYCGLHESNLGRKLDVHHINYGKQTEDDVEENLIALCTSCHVRTNFRRYFWEAYFKMKVQEKDSIQSRLHLIQER